MKKHIIITAFLLAYTVNVGAQTCNPAIISTAPNSRYELLNNGTEVKDKKTNLIWQRCSVGQTWSGSCLGAATSLNWSQALAYAEGGIWRVPNIKELQSLLERSCTNPAINLAIFPNTSNSAWSSSTFASVSSSAWYLNFYSGDSFQGNKGSGPSVRLVRSISN